ISHEIRTPLNGMMATAQLLLASTLNPEQHELAETVLQSCNTLLSILGDILDFTKLDHGAVELQKEPVCMRKAIESCMEVSPLPGHPAGLPPRPCPPPDPT
ncbi:hypothetical protein V8C86DRAFT_1787735, partial [Haematococcus lacustris]